MNSNLSLMILGIIVLIVILPVTVHAAISVGVKTGDWIEYNITYTTSPPQQYLTWSKVEVQSVQSTNVTLKITLKYDDETQDVQTLTANLMEGVPAEHVIPANLNNGDTFARAIYPPENITISRVEERIYAGARRAVLFASLPTQTLYWDKTTGVLVEKSVSFPEMNVTVNVQADKTNMWQSGPFGLPIDPIIFYSLITGAIVLVGAGIFFLMRRRIKI